jgi:hypothetical protein
VSFKLHLSQISNRDVILASHTYANACSVIVYKLLSQELNFRTGSVCKICKERLSYLRMERGGGDVCCCCSCRWGETTSQNCGRQRLILQLDICVRSPGGMILTRENNNAEKMRKQELVSLVAANKPREKNLPGRLHTGLFRPCCPSPSTV